MTQLTSLYLDKEGKMIPPIPKDFTYAKEKRVFGNKYVTVYYKTINSKDYWWSRMHGKWFPLETSMIPCYSGWA